MLSLMLSSKSSKSSMTTHESINGLIVSQDAIVSKAEKKVDLRKNENLHEDAIIVNRTMTTSQGTSYNTKAQQPKNNRKSHCQTCKRDVFNLKRHVMSKRHLNLQQDPNWVPGIRKKYNCPMCNKELYNLKAHKLSKKHLSKCCKFIDCQTAMKGNLKRYQYGSIETIDPKLFIIAMKKQITKLYIEQQWLNPISHARVLNPYCPL